MSLGALLNRACTIVRRSASASTDDYGNPLTAETLIDTMCELQQVRRGEQDDQGELSDTLWLLVLPAGTDIRTGDAVEVGEESYEVFGAPWPVRNPRTGAQSHVEATLRRTASTGDAS